MNAPTPTYSPIVPPPRTRAPAGARGTGATHLPWILAVLAAPFLFGAVHHEIQAALVLLIVASLLLNLAKLRLIPETRAGKIALIGLLAVFLGGMVSLPLSVVQTLSPESARLASRFHFERITWSLSPGDSLIRLWQLAALAGVAVLAREGANVRRVTGILTYGAALAVLVLAGTEFWFLLDGQGIWKEVRHYPAGTFANRNHFASWMAMGVMLIFGALVRKLRHLRSRGWDRKHAAAAGLLGLALGAGLAAVIACGSRGGILALAAGMTFWIVVLYRQRERRASRMPLVVLALSLVIAAVAFGFWGDLFMHRITEGALDFKWRIWRDTVEIAAKFPLVGIGLGAFEPVFSHYKSFGGDRTFLFAENDYLQWMVETGLLGTGCALVLGWLLTRRLFTPVPGKSFQKADLFYGAAAALVAFGAQAAFEFVGHVMATALLAAGLLGLAYGLRERADAPAVAPPPNRGQIAAGLVLAGFLGSVSILQLAAGWKWRNAGEVVFAGMPEKTRREAFELWPIETARAVILTRNLIYASEKEPVVFARGRATADAILREALRWRPLDWPARVERAWLAVADSPSGAMGEIRSAMAVNPLQGEIPLRFATSLARLHPPTALQVLKEGRFPRRDQVREALELAWWMEGSAAPFWELTPVNRDGMETLAEFARDKRLEGLRREALARLETHGDSGGNHH